MSRKMSKCALIFAGSIASTLVLASSATRVFADGNKLTAQQQAAKTEFESDLKQNTDDMRKACGVDIPVTADFENYDKERWLDEAAEREHRRPTDPSYAEWRKDEGEHVVLDANCSSALSEIAALCKQPKWNTVAQQVKRVSCLFSGYLPRKVAEQESMEAHTRRNVIFANGILTVHNNQNLGSVGAIANEVLKEAISRASGAPVEPNRAINRGNGESCVRWAQCESKVCQGGACKMCNANSDCQKGSTCGEGICWTKSDLERTNEPANASKGPASSCKARGAAVIKDSTVECCSKRSKLAKGKRTCL